MRKILALCVILAATVLVTSPLSAQSVCPGYSIIINTPEDALTLAYNGAENPQEQVAALDKFMAEHADSKFLPCAHEYYTMAYLKLNDYDKAIEHGEKAIAMGRMRKSTPVKIALDVSRRGESLSHAARAG